MRIFKICVLGLIVLVAATALLTGCSDDKKGDSGATYTVEDIIGAWTATYADIELKVTSNTSQTGVNPTKEVNGGINITGSVSSALKYQVTLGFLGQYMIMATNTSLLDVLNLDDIPLKASADTSMLSLTIAGTAASDAELNAYDGGTYKDLESDGTGFAFNPGSYAINANNALLSSDDGTLNAACNGTMTPDELDLDKDKAEKFYDTGMPIPAGEAQIVFNADGTFNGNIVMDGENGNAGGQWAIDGNTLTLGAQDLEVLGFAFGGQIEGEVDFEGNNMLCTFEMDLLAELEAMFDEMEEDEIFIDYDTIVLILESLFGMNIGSMKALPVQVTLTMAPAQAIGKTMAQHTAVKDAVAAPFAELLKKGYSLKK